MSSVLQLRTRWWEEIVETSTKVYEKGFNGTPYHEMKKRMPCSSKTNDISNDLADIPEVVDNSKHMATTTTQL